jgi:integrase
MPTPRNKVPSYTRHKASGRAVVRLHGRDHYLGPYGSPESHERYAKLIAGWRSEPTSAPTEGRRIGDPALSINELLVAYAEFAAGYYTKDGKPNKEYDLLRYAMRPLKALFGHSLAADFGPKDLKIVQRNLIDQSLSRSYINGQINRIKRIFKWAVVEQLVSPSVHHGLQALPGLRRGRSEARETRPVRPVPDSHVDAVLPFVAPPVVAMIQLQRLTGMRSGELVLMRTCDIDMSGAVWLYKPSDHKNSWREQSKVIPLGPRAQSLLHPFLKLDSAAYLFSPREAADWHRSERLTEVGLKRRTKIYPCEKRRLALRRQQRLSRKAKRSPRDRYDTGSYRQAIQYGIRRARAAGMDISHWHPHQLRHAKATEIRRQYGLEAAQVMLGHSRADVTEVYAERDMHRAVELALKTG